VLILLLQTKVQGCYKWPSRSPDTP